MPPSAELYRQLYLIRQFEETILREYRSGAFSGTTHTCLGQEANAVGIISQLDAEDIVISNHRCHGHFLAYGGSPRALFAELMGRETGVCGGRGGSQHLHWRNFYSNGILGSTMPLAAGMALAEKRKRSGALTCIFTGDGAMGEGSVYEALNLISLWQLPVLIVVENNRIAQTTPTRLAMAGSLFKRFESFGIFVKAFETSDVEMIAEKAAPIIDSVRAYSQPAALILDTWRFGPHSKSDDTRSDEQISQLRQTYDPLQGQSARLELKELAQIEEQVDAEVQQAFQQALADAPAGGAR
ncbi:MAG TPA: thiamine pyrophosphate-dependent dehydrogenase E1 component subunit alpha [Bellilinea sp.]|nr:thiamine pyrophosphate-dependent dehydrogenase E1 component subunit alpha [Bellilinea sp.]